MSDLDYSDMDVKGRRDHRRSLVSYITLDVEDNSNFELNTDRIIAMEFYQM